ncbi:MAG: hypothetical protein ACXV45_07325 [Halobacteriota archaeon]
MSNVINGPNYHKATENRDLLIISRVRGVYADICEALEQADPDDNERCLALSNFADDIAQFLDRFQALREGRQWAI